MSKFRFLYCIFCTCLLMACNSNPDGVFPDNFVTCDVNGLVWDSIFASAVVDDTDGVFNISIEATNVDLESIFINLTGNSVDGLFNFNNAGTNRMAYAPSGLIFNQGTLMSQDCFPALGRVIISEHDEINKTISGSFEAYVCDFTGTNLVSLSNGFFNKISY